MVGDQEYHLCKESIDMQITIKKMAGGTRPKVTVGYVPFYLCTTV